MSDTPQTDAVVASHVSDHLGKLIELSRRLERELNACLKTIAKQKEEQK